MYTYGTSINELKNWLKNAEPINETYYYLDYLKQVKVPCSATRFHLVMTDIGYSASLCGYNVKTKVINYATYNKKIDYEKYLQVCKFSKVTPSYESYIRQTSFPLSKRYFIKLTKNLSGN